MMTDKELFELVDKLKETEDTFEKNHIKSELTYELAHQLNRKVISMSTYEKFLKWSEGITLKEFKEEVEKLGLEIEEDKYWLKWHIKFKGCVVATIDPINDSIMQTSTLFYQLYFKNRLFELLVNLANTYKEDRDLEDFFEEWQYEE